MQKLLPSQNLRARSSEVFGTHTLLGSRPITQLSASSSLEADSIPSAQSLPSPTYLPTISLYEFNAPGDLT